MTSESTILKELKWNMKLDVVDKKEVEHELKPGQLWQWVFDVEMPNVPKGWWMAQRVTEEGRRLGIAANHPFIMSYGMTFVIIHPDDTGPYQYNLTHVDENGLVQSDPPLRYHVVLIGDTLVWFQHDWLKSCTLLTDVE